MRKRLQRDFKEFIQGHIQLNQNGHILTPKFWNPKLTFSDICLDLFGRKCSGDSQARVLRDLFRDSINIVRGLLVLQHLRTLTDGIIMPYLSIAKNCTLTL